MRPIFMVLHKLVKYIQGSNVLIARKEAMSSKEKISRVADALEAITKHLRDDVIPNLDEVSRSSAKGITEALANLGAETYPNTTSRTRSFVRAKPKFKTPKRARPEVRMEIGHLFIGQGSSNAERAYYLIYHSDIVDGRTKYRALRMPINATDEQLKLGREEKTSRTAIFFANSHLAHSAKTFELKPQYDDATNLEWWTDNFGEVRYLKYAGFPKTIASDFPFFAAQG